MYQYADYEIKRDRERCKNCGRCVRECSNGAHYYKETPQGKTLLADETKCVNCHRCVETCPVRAIKIVKSDLKVLLNSKIKTKKTLLLLRQ